MGNAEPIGEPGRHELEMIRREQVETLHEELTRLPEKLRLAIVLCDLAGLTHAEAAGRLRWPSGSLSVRLMRARGAAPRPPDTPRAGPSIRFCCHGGPRRDGQRGGTPGPRHGHGQRRTSGPRCERARVDGRRRLGFRVDGVGAGPDPHGPGAARGGGVDGAGRSERTDRDCAERADRELTGSRRLPGRTADRSVGRWSAGGSRPREAPTLRRSE